MAVLPSFIITLDFIEQFHIHKEIYTCDNQLYQKQKGREIAKHRTKNIHKSNRKALIFIKCSSHIKHNIPNTIRHENALYKK